ncbi:hypothetical protein HK096_008813 [Nowakowskiella sp. JEL0078]|nr:hypothetical protein HK096_008813 [Nowakowskiella sp. JEL0078]
MHLIVAQHGLWGVPEHLSFLLDKIASQAKNEIHILNVDQNAVLKTYDGLDVCGDRLVTLIYATVLELEKSGKRVVKVSFIGYSFGGLVIRYAIGKLYAKDFFSKHKPINFITIATPHLGVRKDTRYGNLFNAVWNNLVGFFTFRTGKQLVLSDNDLKIEWSYPLNNKPILLALCDPSGPFFQALKLFSKRMIFANTRNDFSSPHATSAIEVKNNFTVYRSFAPNLNYPNIVTLDETKKKDAEEWTLNQFAIVSLFFLLSPLTLPLMLSLMTYRLSNLKSQRLKDGPFQDPAWSWIASFLTSEKPSGSISATSETMDKNLPDYHGLTKIVEPKEPPSEFPDFGNPEDMRLWMIDCLNSVGWEKCYARIYWTNAHAAIVVRRPNDHESTYHIVELLMGGDLNLKKSWHPGTIRHQEKVWKLEKKAEDERKKFEQLRMEKEQERQRMELQELQRSQGVKTSLDRVDWMYAAGPTGTGAVSEEKEAFLLGKKKIGKLLDDGKAILLSTENKDAFNTNAATIYGLTANTYRDIQSKVREDPMLSIKKRMQASLQATLNNPTKLKALKEAAEKKKDRKSKKDKKKRKRSVSSDINDNHNKSRRSLSRSPSPRRIRSRSPENRYSNSPVSRNHRAFDRERQEKPRSPATYRRRSITPDRKRSPSPLRRHRRRQSISDDRNGSPSSPSHRRRRSISDERRRSPPLHRRRSISNERNRASPVTRRQQRTSSTERRKTDERTESRSLPQANSDSSERERKLKEMMQDATTWEVERKQRYDESQKRDAEEEERDKADRLRRLKRETEDGEDGPVGQSFLRDMQKKSYLATGGSAADMVTRNRAYVQRPGGEFMAKG